jgi:hypothetical protein
VITARSLRDEVQNALDYLVTAEIIRYSRPIVVDSHGRVTWRSYPHVGSFLISRAHASIDQYLSWVSNGEYAASLFDGSLLQISYEVQGGEIVGHRLAYVPCPYDIELELLDEGHALADVCDLYRDGDAVLRSPIRFDYDPVSARPNHPATHMTFNSVDCRIACVAPLRVLRFLDFVFRSFYVRLWKAHESFFEAAAWRHAGRSTPYVSTAVHFAWDVNARHSDA